MKFAEKVTPFYNSPSPCVALRQALLCLGGGGAGRAAGRGQGWGAGRGGARVGRGRGAGGARAGGGLFDLDHLSVAP